jgi:redox-sensitive bicupin YhaK (pirin superfamily)
MSVRAIKQTWRSEPTIEGAGVHLRRAFGFEEVSGLDPFLLLDDFRSERPEEYLPGFPWHPHRGIETITYVLEGEVEHGDSLGNAGVIGPGDVQWMTAGSGIIHQEMPRGDARGHMGGLQLWANLPRAQKMTRPRYQGFTAADIPETTTAAGATVKVICGRVGEVSGSVQDVAVEPTYLDVTVPAEAVFVHSVPAGHTVFLYGLEGEADLGAGHALDRGTLALYERTEGDVAVTAGAAGVRFVLVAGKPLGEPVAWRGPIVMNTQEELLLAFREYREGTFIKG